MSQRDSKGRFSKDRPFKVGDRVRSITHIYNIQGMVGEIRKVREDGCCFVHFGDRDDWEPGRSHWPDQMELVEAAPQPKAEGRDFLHELKDRDAEIATLKAEVERERDRANDLLTERDAAEAKLADIKAIIRTFKILNDLPGEPGFTDAVNAVLDGAA